VFDRDLFKDLYPFEPHWLDVGAGVRLHYVDEGKGEPVVMVHGNPTWSFYWRELVKALRGTHRVIAPDHVGMGLSDRPDESKYEYVLDRRVADLEKLITTAVPEGKLTLVLHDWGGMIGLAWATLHPERVAKLILLNTSGFRLPASKPLPLSLKLVRSPVGALMVRGFNGMVRSALSMCAMKPLPPRVALGLAAPYDSWANRLAVLRFVQDIPLDPSHPSWKTVVRTEESLGKLAHVPTLIGWGERDFVFDDHFLREWKTRAPWAEVHAWADAGHYVVEDAADRVIPLVKEFLARPAPVGAAK
jgi:pimeloyl-ACP methyl ester carboxylesterase